MNLKIRKVVPGEIIPLGLSRAGESGYHLRLPLMIWTRRGYWVEWDDFVWGWWRFELCLRFKRQEVSIRWWWNLVKAIK